MCLVLAALSILGILQSFLSFRKSVRDIQFDQFKTGLKETAQHNLIDVNNLLNASVFPDHIPDVAQALSLENLRETYRQGKDSIEVEFMLDYDGTPSGFPASCIDFIPTTMPVPSLS